MDDGPRLEACLFERPLLLGQAVLVAASRVPRWAGVCSEVRKRVYTCGTS